MITYLIQTIFWQVLFLGFYEFFLKKETFFQWNRIYLLGSILVSLVLPIIHLGWFQTTNVVVQTLQPVVIGSQNIEKLSKTSQNSNWLLYLYVAGLIIVSLLFFLKLIRLWQLTRQNSVKNLDGIKLVLIKNQANAFSIFNYIFIDAQLFSKDYLHILKHEQVHIKQKHWLDLWLVEMLKIVFWFNPMLYLYQNKLKELHEYIADTQVLRQVDKETYFNQLLQSVFQTTHISFVNQFYKPSLIKKRIKMQKKQKSGIWAKLKYAVAVVSLLGFISLVDACKDGNTSSKAKEVNKETVKDDNASSKDKEEIKEVEEPDVEVAFQFIQNPPIYPGCEGKKGKALKECMSKKIQEFISSQFDTSIAGNLGLSGERVRINSVFTVDKTGKVSNIKVRSKYKELEKEARRVISKLPRMKPGKAKGEVVKVRYTLPIIFKVEK